MKRLNVYRSLVFSVLITASALPRAGADQLALSDALALARSNAPEIAAAEARFSASEARLRQARGYRLPTISLEEIWIRTDSPAEAFALQLNQESFSFPQFVASDPNNPQAIESATTRLQVSMPLYTGGEVSGRIGQADLASQAAREKAIWAGNGAALAAAEAFIQLAQAREHVSLLERALETVEAHVAMARAYTEQGMLVRSEMLRAEVEHSRVQDLLTEAQGRSRMATANLSFRLGIEPADEWELEQLPAPQPLKHTVQHWIRLADERPDLAAARHLLAAGELEVTVQLAGSRPKLGLVARRDLVDDSPFGTHGDSTSIMAVGNIDLWSGNRHRASAQAASHEIEAARHEVAQFADAIALEVEDAFEQNLSAIERHATSARAQHAAAEAERITTERFAQGVVKMIEVLDAGTARREAETRELLARSEAHLASIRLAVKAGRQPEDVIPLTNPSLSPETTPDEDQ
jgi:outer membrane protein TolC